MTHDELLAEIDEHISWHKDTYTETYAEYITRCTCQEKKYPCDGKKAWVSLRAVVEIKSEDARMAKFKAQDYQDGWDSCLEAVKQAIEKELG